MNILIFVLVLMQCESLWCFAEEFRAHKAINAQDNDTAISLFEKIVDNDPQAFQAWYNLGYLAYKKKDYESAKAYYQQASHTTDNEFKKQLLFNLGNTTIYLKQWQEAKKAFEEFLQLMPESQQGLQSLEYVNKMLEQEKEQQNNQQQNNDKKDDKQSDEQKDQENNNKSEDKNNKDKHNNEDKSDNDLNQNTFDDQQKKNDAQESDKRQNQDDANQHEHKDQEVPQNAQNSSNNGQQDQQETESQEHINSATEGEKDSASQKNAQTTTDNENQKPFDGIAHLLQQLDNYDAKMSQGLFKARMRQENHESSDKNNW